MAVWDGAAAAADCRQPAITRKIRVCIGWGAAPLLLVSFLPLSTEKEKDPKYWRDQAQQTLKNALRLQTLNTNVAKNVIMCSWEMVRSGVGAAGGQAGGEEGAVL